MKVICISGQARHGKDTAAKMMQKSLWGFGKRVLIIHNADLLKFMCAQLFGWNGEKDERGRSLLQYVGTDVIRQKAPDFWVDYITDVLTLFPDKWDYVLIPDCRFPNEIHNLKCNGFDVMHVRVVRDNFDNGLTEEQRQHPSETALDSVAPDLILMNNGDLVELTRTVLTFTMHLYATEEAKLDGKDHSHDIA